MPLPMSVMPGNVLVIGSGGREHAICRKLSESSRISAIFIAPGNAGTFSTKKCHNISLNLNDFDEIAIWCQEHKIDLVFVGPEDPLAKGISNHLSKSNIRCFGPSKEASEIESSKQFAKDFMSTYDIPTARYGIFNNSTDACEFINNAPYNALVVKASGLAAGKGVVVADTKEEACLAVEKMMQDKIFGSAGDCVVIEEKLEGEEVSCLCFTDGVDILCFPPAQDHKRLLEKDTGPNTGGMGAYCPSNLLSVEELKVVEYDVLQKAVDGLRNEGRTFKGVLYAGIMVTKTGIRVLEYNCRFGDPETQVILPMFNGDLYEVALACIEGTLSSVKVDFNLANEKTALCVVAVANGYPASYPKGDEISDLGEDKDDDYIVHAGTCLNDKGSILTNGGRVLSSVCLSDSLSSANETALQRLQRIKCKDIPIGSSDAVLQFRRDIGSKQAAREKLGGSGDSARSKVITYASSGVDIESGESLVNMIGPACRATNRPGCCSNLGLFGSVFDLKLAGYDNPLLVSGTDGVGTKLKIAMTCDNLHGIGQDLVAMCVNDILCHGAEPLFFLDYYACGQLNVSQAATVIRGIADACRLVDCALVGGETAEMPGIYSSSDFDLAGFVVGAVERNCLLPKVDRIQEGDCLIGLSSSGLHSNGFSLVRKIIEKAGYKYSDPSPFNPGKSLGEALLEPTHLYSKHVIPLLRNMKFDIRAAAHITGGGLLENLPRVLPDGMGAVLNGNNWNVPNVVHWLFHEGSLPCRELSRTFNLGLGLILVVSPETCQNVLDELVATNPPFQVSVVGKIVAHPKKRVIVKNLTQQILNNTSLIDSITKRSRCDKRIPVGVLISGSGTNLQALLDHCANPSNQSKCRIAVVISNVPGVKGLARAESFGVPTRVISHKNFASRPDFEARVDEVLNEFNCQLICLAGFMRILSPYLVNRWSGRLINIHPSLLPSFKGAHAHRDVLKSGVKISGATVHFVVEDVDAGAIIHQGSAPVLVGDTEESLSERIKTEVEHRIYPEAMELVATGKCKLTADNTVHWI